MQSNSREINHHWVWSVMRPAMRIFALFLLLLTTPLTNPANTAPISSNESVTQSDESLTCKYEFSAAYDLAGLIREMASKIVSRDLSADNYSKSERMTSEKDSAIYTVYERDAVRIEYTTFPSSPDSSERTIWNAHIPGAMLPEYLLPKQYYVSKLGLNVGCNKLPTLEIESDADTILIQFNGDIVTSIALKVDPGVN